MTADETSPPTVAVLAETEDRERRVAVIPPDVARLRGQVAFVVERGAGMRAGFDDEAYEKAGAKLSDRSVALGAADLVVSVRPPSPSGLRPGVVVVSLGGRDTATTRQFDEMGVTHLGLERLPRITRAQGMDVLSSQATIAGYAAVIEAARSLDVLLPMLTTAAGGIKPAKMVALGAGVAGLQAIATARRLGAIAHGFDVRAAAREQVESLGARFLSVPEVGEGMEAAGGYATEQTAVAQERLRRAIAEHLAPMQLIVTAAQVPGRPAPVLIDEQTIALLGPGTVIVDLAAETGGNCTLTVADEVVERNGVRILGPTDMPSVMATDASRLFSGNVRQLLTHLIGLDQRLRLKRDDEITGALLGESQPVAA